MSLKLFEEFPPVSTGRWEEAIRKDLKGADYARKLIWQTDEGIAVKPYYRAEDAAGLEYLEAPPGAFPYTRGSRASNEWRVRESVQAPDAEQARAQALEALASGAGEIEFVLGPRGFEPRDAPQIAALIEGLGCPVHFAAGERAAEVLPLLAEALPGEVSGSLDYDPLAGGGATGAAAVRAVLDRAPAFRPLAVRAYRFHDAGGSAVQELGYALAAGVEYMAELTDAGMPAEQAATALAFSFASGSSFFFEIAKLRAARMLWARALEGFGVLNSAAKPMIHSRGSLWNKTVYDPWVNALRGATEAMSAAMGGCDSLSVAPFDIAYRYPDDFSRRLARNTQLILKHEAWLDPAGGPAGGAE